MGFAVAALLFLRFWRRTREGLFLAFAASFLLMGVMQAMLTLGDAPVEERSWLFLLRLAAFSLILAALWWQNRRKRRVD
jgi:uncharacterized membrane protein HdeD (DUF308 family)